MNMIKSFMEPKSKARRGSFFLKLMFSLIGLGILLEFPLLGVLVLGIGVLWVLKKYKDVLLKTVRKYRIASDFVPLSIVLILVGILIIFALLPKIQTSPKEENTTKQLNTSEDTIQEKKDVSYLRCIPFIPYQLKEIGRIRTRHGINEEIDEIYYLINYKENDEKELRNRILATIYQLLSGKLEKTRLSFVSNEEVFSLIKKEQKGQIFSPYERSLLKEHYLAQYKARYTLSDGKEYYSYVVYPYNPERSEIIEGEVKTHQKDLKNLLLFTELMETSYPYQIVKTLQTENNEEKTYLVLIKDFSYEPTFKRKIICTLRNIISKEREKRGKSSILLFDDLKALEVYSKNYDNSKETGQNIPELELVSNHFVASYNRNLNNNTSSFTLSFFPYVTKNHPKLGKYKKDLQNIDISKISIIEITK